MDVCKLQFASIQIIDTENYLWSQYVAIYKEFCADIQAESKSLWAKLKAF